MMAILHTHRRVLLDLTCVLLVGLIVLVFEVFVDPRLRGFFCDDDTIHYPLLPNTVSTTLLVAVSFLLPLFIFVSVDGFRLLYTSTPRDSWHSVTTQLLTSLYQLCGVFLFGAGLNQVTVDIGKYFIGRLRPHFWQVCQPQGDVCPASASATLYVTDYVCTGDKQAVREARLSFPSGHSALAFYAAVYVAVFLQSRRTVWSSRLATHVGQAIVLMLAWYTALSRVADYAHHPTDVIAGILIGSFWAMLMVTYVADLSLDNQLVSKEELRSLRPSSVSTGINNV